jgi:hypothetical protein
MSGRDTEPVDVYFEWLIRESDDAWLVETADGQEVWLSKSECEMDEAANMVTVPEWLAFKKGLI